MHIIEIKQLRILQPLYFPIDVPVVIRKFFTNADMTVRGDVNARTFVHHQSHSLAVRILPRVVHEAGMVPSLCSGIDPKQI